jgi:cation:H+ antiporter
MTLILGYVALAALGTAVVWWGSGVLETASERLAVYYRLPPVVQGAVIAAVGSSFPELSSTVLATLLHGTFDLGVSAIVGSAIFNILVIPGISGLVGPSLKANRDLVYKDAQFYVTSVVVLLLTFALAVIYLPANPDASGPAALVGVVNRPLALIPVALYGLYLFLQQQDTRDHRLELAGELDVQRVVPWRLWLWLLVSLVVILVGVEGLVVAALGFGEVFDTPDFLWGVTVVAAGTSLPDAFISVRAARGGDGTVSIANVLGSNIFDLLIAVPAGILIAGAATVDFRAAVPMMAFLTVATLVLFVFIRLGLALSRRESVVLLLLYALFLVWMGLETVGWVRLVVV